MRRCLDPCLVFLLSLVLPLPLAAQQYCAYRMRTHATNCLLVTDGDVCDLCYEQDEQRLWKCEPSVAGETCSGAEWKEIKYVLTDADVPNSITVTLAATATALATDPTACSAGQFVSDIAATGTLTCGTPAGGGSSAFNAITTGTNTTATMTVGSGASLVPAGTGIITATGGATNFTVGTVTDAADTGGINFDNNANGPCWEASPTGTDVCLVANAAEQVSVTGGTFNLSAANVSGTITRSIYVRADAFYTQGNCVLVTDTAPIAAGLVHPYITCADTTGDNFHTNFVMPDCWNAGTVTIEAMAWITTAAGTTTLTWSGESVADNETVGPDISDTGGQTTAFTHTAYAANDEAHVTSAALTVNGAGAGEHLYLEARTTGFTAGFKFGGMKLEFACNQSGD
jgi:hypothetical protein